LGFQGEIPQRSLAGQIDRVRALRFAQPAVRVYYDGEMALTDEHRRIFRRGSRTYFNSSLFFPRGLREDVFVLYAFVRVADNFVDCVPQDGDGFHRYAAAYRKARSGSPSGDDVIDEYVRLEQRLSFPPEWTEAFIHSMELDLTKKVYSTVEETLEYVYGSAEVIGLLMARIMRLDPIAGEAARMLGRAMQFINFIRDIDEDNGLGRVYLPIGETHLPDLLPRTARRDPDEFVRFLHSQLDRYRKWQDSAERGYRFIPHRYLIPIKTAADMYNWTATRLERDPFVVFERKVKPGRSRILATVAVNALFARRLARESHRD